MRTLHQPSNASRRQQSNAVNGSLESHRLIPPSFPKRFFALTRSSYQTHTGASLRDSHRLGKCVVGQGEEGEAGRVVLLPAHAGVVEHVAQHVEVVFGGVAEFAGVVE